MHGQIGGGTDRHWHGRCVEAEVRWGENVGELAHGVDREQGQRRMGVCVCALSRIVMGQARAVAHRRRGQVRGASNHKPGQTRRSLVRGTT
jgi:oxalate decarboxylase/phosphoglucose isomerase-like protein (cupin superfamily)